MNKTPSNPSAARFVRIGRDAILDLLNREHAVVWLEVEAKLAEQPYPGTKDGINPHILSTAKTQLLKAGKIEQIGAQTRGGRTVDVLALTDRTLKKTVFEATAARKRLLQARYLSWGTTSAKAPNMIGEAGERVARASLRAITGVGYMPHANNSDVNTLFGQKLPSGSLDDVAYLTVLEKDKPVAVTLAIEVKNIRHWIYPNSDELYQLLDKCTQIQAQNPAERLVPVLVCRRAHFTAYLMAKDLGFVLLPTYVQPILPRSEVPPDDLQEVCDELGYNLVRTDQPLDKLVGEFERNLPKIAARTAAHWAVSAPQLASFFQSLRDSQLPQRSQEMENLRAAAKQIPDTQGGW